MLIIRLFKHAAAHLMASLKAWAAIGTLLTARSFRTALFSLLGVGSEAPAVAFPGWSADAVSLVAAGADCCLVSFSCFGVTDQTTNTSGSWTRMEPH
jgi:hypothetical protein